MPTECCSLANKTDKKRGNLTRGGSRILKGGGGGVMISLRWISGFWIVGPLRAELALSTVATVTRIIARYETLCRGVARNFYILRQEIGLGFVAT